MKPFTIPESYTVGGQEMNIKYKIPEEMPHIGTLGRCYVAKGQLLINSEQTESSKRNTFFHEMVHSILDTMGNDTLSNDESFVSTFAGFLMEIHNSAKID